MLAGGVTAIQCLSHTIKQCVHCSLGSNGGSKWKALLRLWKPCGWLVVLLQHWYHLVDALGCVVLSARPAAPLC